MATKSFTDTYVIERSDVDRFHNIMNNDKQVKPIKVVDHKDVKGEATVEMLGLGINVILSNYFFV